MVAAEGDTKQRGEAILVPKVEQEMQILLRPNLLLNEFFSLLNNEVTDFKVAVFGAIV
jgi:hypothetical protein